MNQWDKKNLRVQRKVAARDAAMRSAGCGISGCACIFWLLVMAAVIGTAAAIAVNIFWALT